MNIIFNSSATEITHLTNLVTACSPVEKMYLLGNTTMQRRTISVFCSDQPSYRYTSHYYLLLLVHKEDEHSLNCVQDKIESALKDWIPVTVLVVNISCFINWLNTGHRFAVWVVERASLLYDASNITLPLAASRNEEASQLQDKKLMKDTVNRVASFLAGADLYRLRKEYKLAAFMLHQAAEQALRTSLIINIGFRINTHNIERLIRYNALWCDKLLEIFPKNNSREEQLRSLLQKAYIGSRYSLDYSLSGNDLEELHEKVIRLTNLLNE